MSHVLVLVFTELRKDPRVLRHVDALKDDYEVTTCAKGPGLDGVPHIALPDDADLWPMSPIFMGMQSLAAVRTAYPRSPLVREARRALTKVGPFDLVLSNDVEALPVALEAARGAPVVADLHEFAPEQFSDDWRWRLVRSRFLARLCTDFIHRARAATTVSNGIARRYAEWLGIPLPAVVMNAGRFRYPQPTQPQQPLRLVHSGLAIPDRQLERMVSAAAGLPNLVFDLYLVGAPMQHKYLEQLKAQAHETSNVRVLDPVPMSDVPETLDAYDLGLYLLPPTNFNNRHALPNKFFDFIQSGLAIMVGPSPEMGELVSQFRMGRVLPTFEEGDLRKELAKLDSEPVWAWKQATCSAASVLSGEHAAETLCKVVADCLSD